MKKEQKINIVSEFKGLLENSKTLVASDYRGMNVEKLSILRNDCGKSGAVFRVIKNTLAKKAISGTSFESAESFFEGPTAVAVGGDDPVAVIKVLTGHAKDSQYLKIKGGVLDGEKYSPEEILRIATLPSREELIAKIVGSLSSPLRRMVGSLNNPLNGLVGVLHSYARAKEGN